MSMSLDIHVAQYAYESLTAANVATRGVPLPAGKWEVQEVKHCTHVAVTADPTNNAVLSVKKGATTIATVTTTAGGTGTMALNALKTIALSASLGQSAVFDGSTDPVIFDIAKGGTGVTVQGEFMVTFKKVSN